MNWVFCAECVDAEQHVGDSSNTNQDSTPASKVKVARDEEEGQNDASEERDEESSHGTVAGNTDSEGEIQGISNCDRNRDDERSVPSRHPLGRPSVSVSDPQEFSKWHEDEDHGREPCCEGCGRVLQSKESVRLIGVEPICNSSQTDCERCREDVDVVNGCDE